MSINVNKKNYDSNFSNLNDDSKYIYEILTDTIPRIEENFDVKVTDSLTFSTTSGSLKDEHNGKIYYRALSGLNQLVKYQIINSFTEEDVSKDTEHAVKFDIK